MDLKIVCFEDSQHHRDDLVRAFAQYGAKFLFFADPGSDWKVQDCVADEISAFAPTFAVVDLRDDKHEDRVAGLRTIRRLRQNPKTAGIPIVAWSVLFTETPQGHETIEKVKDMGAAVVAKSRAHPDPDRMLSAAGVFLKRRAKSAL
jgi:CheY-like chemotaxis protein